MQRKSRGPGPGCTETLRSCAVSPCRCRCPSRVLPGQPGAGAAAFSAAVLGVICLDAVICRGDDYTYNDIISTSTLTRTYTSLYIYIQLSLHIGTLMSATICINAAVSIYLSVCIYTDISIFMYLYIHIFTYLSVSTPIYRYLYIYVWISVHFRSLSTVSVYFDISISLYLYHSIISFLYHLCRHLTGYGTSLPRFYFHCNFHHFWQFLSPPRLGYPAVISRRILEVYEKAKKSLQ